VQRAGLTGDDREAVRAVVARHPQCAPIAAELLRGGKDEWWYLWETYFNVARKECTDLALAEATGTGGDRHRHAAVEILRRVDDPRRIAVFKDILRGTNRWTVLPVLEAVRDQYLVELGEETLAQLRNPDADVRGIALQAIEKLKFYAEARKAFEK
jgi:hypothetical protein